MGEEKGGRLIALNAPVGMTFGIDAMSYTVGEKFRGVQDIPPGLHFCHYSIGAGDEQQGNGFGGRHGFFFAIESSYDVVAWSWDNSLEDFVPALSSSSKSSGGLSEGSLTNLIESSRRGELDRNLGPYPRDKELLWNQLSDFINLAVLDNCGLAVGVKVLPGDPEECMVDSDDEMDYETTTKLVNYFDDAGRVASFPFAEPPLPRLYRNSMSKNTSVGNIKKEGGTSSETTENSMEDVTCEEATSSSATNTKRTPTKQGESLNKLNPSERTTWCIDGSERVLQIVASAPHQGSWESLLGEVQLAFILFSLNFSFPALKHWKNRIALITSCGDKALESMPLLFTCLCRCLAAQLEFVPSDFFDVELTSGSFLEPCLRSLFLHISQHVAAPSTKNTVMGSVNEKGDNCDDDSLIGDLSEETKGFNLMELEQGKERLLVIVRDRFHLFLQEKTSTTEKGDNNDGDINDDDDDNEFEYDIDGGLNQHLNVSKSGYHGSLLHESSSLPGFTGFEPDDELPTVVDFSEITERMGYVSVEDEEKNISQATPASQHTSIPPVPPSNMVQSSYFGISVLIPMDSSSSKTAISLGANTASKSKAMNTPSPPIASSLVPPISLLMNDKSLLEKYPSLIGAMNQGEDIIMTARRILDLQGLHKPEGKETAPSSKKQELKSEEEEEEEEKNSFSLSSDDWISPTAIDRQTKVKEDAIKFLENEVAVEHSSLWKQQQQPEPSPDSCTSQAPQITPSICQNLGLD